MLMSSGVAVAKQESRLFQPCFEQRTHAFHAHTC